MKKILVVRFSSMGDIILCTPVIRALKQQLNAEVHFLTKKTNQTVLQHNPYLDKQWLLDKNENQLFKELRSQNFNVIIDLHKNLRTQKLKLKLGIKSYSFNKLNYEKWLATQFKVNRLPEKHLVDRYFDGLQPIGITNDGLGLDHFIGRSADEILPVKIPRDFVVLVLGATHHTKQIPTRLCIELITGNRHNVVLVGGKDVEKKSQEIMAQVDNDSVVNTCGKLSINESAQVIQNSKAVITGDTGMMHIAAALKKPIASIWGNTIPDFGMYPYYGDSKINEMRSEVETLNCRPCSKIGFDQCPKKHFNCMEQQKTQAIITWVNSLNEQD